MVLISAGGACGACGVGGAGGACGTCCGDSLGTNKNSVFTLSIDFD